MFERRSLIPPPESHKRETTFTVCGLTAGGSGIVSTAVRAKTAARIHNTYGLFFMRDTDSNDNGFPAFAIYNSSRQTFARPAESLVQAQLMDRRRVYVGSQRGNQQLGFIGNDAVNSHIRQADHRGFFIDGPREYFLAGCVNVGN